jgi:ferric-dicitrate binding protein FerR (iron transport regulator)
MLHLIDRKLFVRFLTGNGNEKEKYIISEKSQKHNGLNFSQIQKIWQKAAPNTPPIEQFDVDAAWNALNTRIESAGSISQPLHRANPRNLNTLFTRFAKIAAVLLIAFGIFQLVRPAQKLNTVSSEASIASPVTLSDGSVIHLNRYSSIKYPEKFGKTKRDVYFWGEAFFDIAADKTKPFVIEVGETRVKVVGTSFDVKANPESDRIEVIVNSGKVLFYTESSSSVKGEQVFLEPGDKGVYVKATRKISKFRNDDMNFLSWKTGILTFRETGLPEVLYALNQKFGANFVIRDNGLKQLRLTAKFDNESLDSVLDVLRLVFDIKIQQNGKDYLILKNDR